MARLGPMKALAPGSPSQRHGWQEPLLAFAREAAALLAPSFRPGATVRDEVREHDPIEGSRELWIVGDPKCGFEVESSVQWDGMGGPADPDLLRVAALGLPAGLGLSVSFEQWKGEPGVLDLQVKASATDAKRIFALFHARFDAGVEPPKKKAPAKRVPAPRPKGNEPGINDIRALGRKGDARAARPLLSEARRAQSPRQDVELLARILEKSAAKIEIDVLEALATLDGLEAPVYGETGDNPNFDSHEVIGMEKLETSAIRAMAAAELKRRRR